MSLVLEALCAAEQFIAGFEDDEMQAGVRTLLTLIRAAKDELTPIDDELLEVQASAAIPGTRE